MIVQCEACQTRFRLADEKIKPGGTKVRCSKCKEVFSVMPPEPEPVEEAVDFGSFNMEEVADDAPAETAASESIAEGTPATGKESPQESASEISAPPAESKQEESSDLDFSDLESEMGATVPDNELADEFSFVDTSQLADEEETDAVGEASAGEEAQEEGPLDEQTDFDDAFSETSDPDNALEFEFSEEPETTEAPTSDEIDFSTESPSATDEIDFSTDEPAGSDEIDFSTGESADDSALSFGEEAEATQEQDEPGEFSFGDDSDDNAFAFGDDEETPAEDSEESSGPGEFSFDDGDPFADDSPSEWDEPSDDSTSFDFEEPQFDTEDTSAEAPAAESGSDDLQFGEIDFAGDTEDDAPGFASNDDFSQATMEEKEEPESFSPQQESAPPRADEDDDDLSLPAPPPAKKSSLSRILILLVLLLVLLGGAAGILFMQEGTLNLNTVTQYLPFLQDYIGEAPASAPGDRIGINVSGSSYVNGTEGQMLIIQGAAVNNHPSTRSAITIKGVLLDAKGQTLLQQTVFCGNRLNDDDLKTMSFAAIEEAMNNQFGDSLSNMNVAAGASIPFTIVFRNVPEGLANINVEVVDSKPGAG
jgi:predicted Zn finger-like uncharacterized protein